MASISKTKSGKFQAVVYLGRDENGKMIRRTITRDREKDVKLEAARMEDAAMNASALNYEKVKVTDWFKDWLNMNENRLSPSTVALYDIYLEAHYKPYFKNLTLGKLTDVHITKFVNEKSRELSGTTVRKMYYPLNKALRAALKWRNPAEHVELPEKNKFTAKLMTDNEVQILLDRLRGTKYEIIILLTSWGGLRRGEIAALTWADIDFKNEVVRINKASTLGREGYVIKDKPKSQHGFREVAYPMGVFDLLQEWQSQSKGETVFDMKPGSITHWFTKIKKELKLNVRFHDLRHYHSSWLYKQGIPDQQAAKRLGHDIQTLKQIYQHIDVDMKLATDDIIKDLLNKKTQ